MSPERRAAPRFRRLITQPGPGALLEIGLLFLPALPAYLWMWPAVTGTRWWAPVQVASYLYLLAGGLVIGLRRWRLSELGWNRRGIGWSLTCGAVLLLARTLVVVGTSLYSGWHPPDAAALLGDVLFYLGPVGLVEELLFRGVVYRALEVWRGPAWAIWGSSLGFGLYHIAWQGLAGIAGGLIIGLIFALMRRRAGGFVGLVLVHAAIDLGVLYITPLAEGPDLWGVQIPHPAPLLAGTALLVLLVLYLVWAARRSPSAEPIPAESAAPAAGTGPSI